MEYFEVILWNTSKNGARLYHPALGRWMSIDPQDQFASPYVALGNNFINGVDPDGEFWQTLLKAGLMNVLQGAHNGNVNNFGDGLRHFATGAASAGLAFINTGTLLGNVGVSALGGGIISGLSGSGFLNGAIGSGLSALGTGLFSEAYQERVHDRRAWKAQEKAMKGLIACSDCAGPDYEYNVVTDKHGNLRSIKKVGDAGGEDQHFYNLGTLNDDNSVTLRYSYSTYDRSTGSNIGQRANLAEVVRRGRAAFMFGSGGNPGFLHFAALANPWTFAGGQFGVGALSQAARAGGSYIARQAVTQAGRYVLRKAVANPIMKPGEIAAAARNSKLLPMMRGKGIDRAFREFARRNIVFKYAKKWGLIQINPSNRGADIVGGKILRGRWWDVTTRRQWARHVKNYGKGGKGLFY